MPIAESSVRETMDLTSSLIDDTNAGWSGRLGRNFSSLRTQQSLRRRRWVVYRAARQAPPAPTPSDLAETAQFLPPRTPTPPAGRHTLHPELSCAIRLTIAP